MTIAVGTFSNNLGMTVEVERAGPLDHSGLFPVCEGPVRSRGNVGVVVVGRERARWMVPTDLAHGEGPGGWACALRQNVLNNLVRRRRAGVVISNPKKGASVTDVTTSDLGFFRGFIVAWRERRAIVDLGFQHKGDRTGKGTVFV